MMFQSLLNKKWDGQKTRHRIGWDGSKQFSNDVMSNKIDIIDKDYGFGQVLIVLKDGTKFLCKHETLIQLLLDKIHEQQTKS